MEAITFLVKQDEIQYSLWTSAGYVCHIVWGLRSHGVPEDYVQHVIDVAIRTNQNAADQSSAQREIPRIETLRKAGTTWNQCR